MKLADLQLATELQAKLARLDAIPAGCALLEANGLDIELSADELASFIDWRRAELHRELRRLGVQPESEEYPEERSGTAREAPGPRGERIVAQPRSVGVQPAAQRPRMTRVEALEEATRIVMGPIYAEWQAGQLDDPGENDPRAAGDRKFAELRERRRLLIDEEAARLMTGVVVAMCDCGRPSTTIIGGRPLCDEHAAAAPRAELPLRLVR